MQGDNELADAELLKIVIESNHSRFPVIGEDRDEVVGILLAKDLLRYFVEGGRASFDIKECLRPAVFIPESKRLNVLLKEFRVSHHHMAIVVDEYGGVIGLVTGGVHARRLSVEGVSASALCGLLPLAAGAVLVVLGILGLIVFSAST